MNMGLPQSMFEPQFDKHVMQKIAFRANLCMSCSLGYNLLYIFVGHFYRAIHLGSIRYRIVMLYLELGAYFCHHVIVQIKPVVGYNSLWKSVSTYNFFLDETGYHWLRHTGIWCCLYPFGKVIDDHEDETMAVWGFWGYRSNHVHAPHWKRQWWHHYV